MKMIMANGVKSHVIDHVARDCARTCAKVGNVGDPFPMEIPNEILPEAILPGARETLEVRIVIPYYPFPFIMF